MLDCFLLPHCIYWFGAYFDWKTTKELIIDPRQAGEPGHKELNPIIRWVLGSPDSNDEWRLAAFKFAIWAIFFWGLPALGLPLSGLLWGFVPVSHFVFITLGIMQVLIALSNKYGWLNKLYKNSKIFRFIADKLLNK